MIPITRVTEDYAEIVQAKLARTTESFAEVDRVVQGIMEDVKKRGDEALRYYTAKFDGVDLDSMEVSAAEIQEALDALDPELKAIMLEARENIAAYHREQKEKSWLVEKGPGIILGQKLTPLHRVGDSTRRQSRYPSTVLMTVVPAVIAGVEEIILHHRQIARARWIRQPAAAAIAGCTKVYRWESPLPPHLRHRHHTPGG